MKLTKNVALTKQERLSTAAFFSLAVMRKFILYSKFLHLFCTWVAYFKAILPSPSSLPTRSCWWHFWVLKGEQTSHLLSGMREILFLLQFWKLVPPRKRVVRPSVCQLPANLHSSISSNVTLLPSVRCHGNEKRNKHFWNKHFWNWRGECKRGDQKTRIRPGSSCNYYQLTC